VYDVLYSHYSVQFSQLGNKITDRHTYLFIYYKIVLEVQKKNRTKHRKSRKTHNTPTRKNNAASILDNSASSPSSYSFIKQNDRTHLEVHVNSEAYRYRVNKSP